MRHLWMVHCWLCVWPMVTTTAQSTLDTAKLIDLLSPLSNDLSGLQATLDGSLVGIQVAVDLIRSTKSDVSSMYDQVTQRLPNYPQTETLLSGTTLLEQKLSTVANAVQLMEFSHNRIDAHVSQVCNHLIKECESAGVPSAAASTSTFDDNPPKQQPVTPFDCSETAEQESGVRDIYLGAQHPVRAYCDQASDGRGAWTVFIRRQKQDPQLNFQRNLRSYVDGFGDPSGEYWLGLDNLHALTTNKSCELLVLVARGSRSVKSYYDSIVVEGGDDEYKLNVAGYDADRSTAGDSLSYHSGWRFSTSDHDRDGARGGSCVGWSGGGGWWYNHCFTTNPTGIYLGDRSPRSDTSDDYLEWRGWQGRNAFLTELSFMVRPRL